MRKVGFILLFAALVGWLVVLLMKQKTTDLQTIGITQEQLREEFERFREELSTRLIPLEDAIELINERAREEST